MRFEVKLGTRNAELEERSSERLMFDVWCLRFNPEPGTRNMELKDRSSERPTHYKSTKADLTGIQGIKAG